VNEPNPPGETGEELTGLGATRALTTALRDLVTGPRVRVKDIRFVVRELPNSVHLTAFFWRNGREENVKLSLSTEAAVALRDQLNRVGL
jgi:hypothetical protein